MWRARFIGKIHLASDIWEFRFERPEGYDYLPGQYAALVVPEPLDDPRGQGRTMSFISHPDDGYLSFVTRIPEQLSPFKRHLALLSEGSELLVDAALGDLVLPRSTAIPLVFVAGGIGLASFVGMLKDLQKTGENRTVHLLYALRKHEEKLFPELLRDFSFASRHDYVSPDRLSAEIILRSADDEPAALYYLSGTEQFVESLRADLLGLGLTDTQIVFDYFTGYFS